MAAGGACCALFSLSSHAPCPPHPFSLASPPRATHVSLRVADVPPDVETADLEARLANGEGDTLSTVIFDIELVKVKA